MRSAFFRAVALAAVAMTVVLVGAASAATPAYSNDFETNTDGWFGLSGSTITQRDDGYTNPGGYADGINAAGGTHFAGLNRGTCSIQVGGGGDTVNCPGPYTNWGGYNDTWTGGYTTQVDIYLDTAYANAHPDTYGGNLDLVSGSSDPAEYGTRFDFSSAINDSSGNFLRDFGFNVSTGYAGDNCDGFLITGQTNVNRTGANPNAGRHDPQCIATTGWYTFKHTFSDNGGYLDVLMQIFPEGSSTPAASWDITTTDLIAGVGCNRYGWFTDQEIYGLPIDNASMTGCGAPVISGGQIAPTKTTCEEYTAGTADTLDQVLYTLKDGTINSVSPGVFFYYGKISGTEGQAVTISQTNDNDAPAIPVQHGQVILYDTSCNVVKWEETDTTGVVTGTLPSTGDFIISVKYDANDLKGVSDPGTVTYTFDGATVELAPKH